MAYRFKRGDPVLWHSQAGNDHMTFPGEVDTVRGNNVYVLFPNREAPTGGHWLTHEELEPSDAL